MPKRKAGKMAKAYDPIAPVAEEISEEACLLCFDEFQVKIFSMMVPVLEFYQLTLTELFFFNLFVTCISGD